MCVPTVVSASSRCGAADSRQVCSISCTMEGVESTFTGRWGGDISGVTVTSRTFSIPGCNESFTPGTLDAGR